MQRMADMVFFCVDFFRATQQAQISEKKANNLSRRFVSYIFQ